MAHGIGTIEVKNRKGHPTVLGLGKTPRGQKFIRTRTALKVTSMSDPDFKKELAAAVDGMLGQAVLSI